MPVVVERGSFRDPAGFVYTAEEGTLLRQVNKTFAAEFDACSTSGLYAALFDEGLLIPHVVADLRHAATPDAHAVIAPARIPFISYPYEWSFGELKDAALLTLTVLERALARGFVLRDASAYNVQFHEGRPVFIDTLSFEPYREGTPWGAYQQYCEHFLVPLMLMARCDIRCGQLLRANVDGIPLELGSRLLPRGTWLSPSALIHVHMHARAGRKYEEASVSTVVGGRTMSRRALVALVDGLRAAVDALTWEPGGTEWADYVGNTNYSDAAHEAKRRLVREMLEPLGARTLWDLGGNTGEFSRVARAAVPNVVCFDFDPAAVERNYRQVKAEGEGGILPLLLDLMNPSPDVGWANEERRSLAARGPADVVMALALVHHLAIARNVPLPRVAAALARLGRTLLIEFVPKHDSQVVRLLRNRPDIFPDYTPQGFEAAFDDAFEIVARRPVEGSQRTLYLMRARG